MLDQGVAAGVVTSSSRPLAVTVPWPSSTAHTPPAS
jgi:hypothetical protein